MNNVIIVSKCLRVTKFKTGEAWYEFHFKGVCAGKLIKKVILRGLQEEEIKKGSEYFIYVRCLSLEDSTLRGEMIKSKLLDDCWDRS